VKSLRGLWLAMFASVVLIVVASAAALIIVTTLLHRTTSDTVQEVESLLALQRMTTLLLPGDASTTTPARARHDLDRLLSDAARHDGGDSEAAAAVREARVRLEEYLRHAAAVGPNGPASPEIRRAVAALHGLAEHNARQARALELQSAAWDNAGDVVGYASIGLALVLAVLLSAISRRMVHPARELAGTIRRYTAGQRQVRAAIEAPQELRDIAVGFNEMAEELDRETHRRMAFLGGVAHDLRNPLVTLRLSLGFVPSDQPLPPEPVIRQTLARTERQLGRLERMIHDFLDSARIEAGSLQLQLEVCDLRQLVPSVIELFRPGSPGHSIQTSVPDEPVLVNGDPVRIEQVLINLVSNAIKYSPDGGDVCLRVGRQAGTACVAVSDRGVGIRPQDLDAVFRPFGRSAAAREAIPGVGLGLFVARRIALAHGGSLEVESELGKGSTFRLCLPLVEDRTAEA
jgi:signal transduction histidine kinase